MRKPPLNFLLLPQLGVGLLGLLGLVLLVWPDVLLSLFPPLIGVTLMLVGALGIASYAATKDRRAEPGLKLLQSIATLAVGFVFMANRSVSSSFLAILFGLYVIVTSVLGICAAISGKLRGRELWFSILQSAVYLVWGLMLLFAPFSGKALWARFLGGYFIVVAVFGILRLRSVQKQIEEKLRQFHARRQPSDGEGPES